MELQAPGMYNPYLTSICGGNLHVYYISFELWASLTIHIDKC